MMKKRRSVQKSRIVPLQNNLEQGEIRANRDFLRKSWTFDI
jgi:hypothetical protein